MELTGRSCLSHFFHSYQKSKKEIFLAQAEQTFKIIFVHSLPSLVYYFYFIFIILS